MGECLLGLIHTGCDVGRANCNFCQFSPHYTPTTLGSKKNVTGSNVIQPNMSSRCVTNQSSETLMI